MKKNLKWIILGIVVIIAIIIGIIVIVNEVQFNYKVEGISEYNYFVFIQENQYGVVDKNGFQIFGGVLQVALQVFRIVI